MGIIRRVLVLLILGLAIGVTSFTGLYAASNVSPGDGSPTDPNIAYFGRWDKSSASSYTSYWPGAYFKTNFTGTTVKLKLAGPAEFYVRLDSSGDTYFSVSSSGTINLTPAPLSPGQHTLRVAARSETDLLQFQGLILDAGAITLAPGVPNNLVEFIGDSITAGYNDTKWALSDYAWLAGEKLNVEHTQIAYSGICLVDGVPCFSPNAIGMSRQFFKLQTVDYPNSPAWDFTGYQPSVVVINLGTNDAYFGVADSLFQTTYVTFLQNIRTKFPDAQILVLRTFNGSKAAPTQQAVNTRHSAGDAKVHYIDTTGWITASDTIDGTHPSDSGQLKIANLIVPILQPYLANCPPYNVTSSLDDGSGFACGTLSYALNKAAVDPTGSNITINLPGVTLLSGPMPVITPNTKINKDAVVTLAGGCTVSNGRLTPNATLRVGGNAPLPGLTVNSNVNLNGIDLSGFSGYALKFTGKNNKMSCSQVAGGGLRVTLGGQLQMLPGNQVKLP
jgi:lysophospholipase L1-like esterase